MSDQTTSDEGYHKVPGGTAPRTAGQPQRTERLDKLGRVKRPEQYPIQLKVNITEATAVRLSRVCQCLGIPNGIAARNAIVHYVFMQERALGIAPRHQGDGNA
jgi:hypothetical protein